MAKPTVASPPKIAPETIGRMAAEIVGVPVREKGRQPVADMLHNLMTDMAALRRMNVGEAEPGTIYDAAEAVS